MEGIVPEIIQEEVMAPIKIKILRTTKDFFPLLHPEEKIFFIGTPSKIDKMKSNIKIKKRP